MGRETWTKIHRGKMRYAEASRSQGTVGDWILPQGPRVPASSDLGVLTQNCEGMLFCCLWPPIFWTFITVVLGGRSPKANQCVTFSRPQDSVPAGGLQGALHNLWEKFPEAEGLEQQGLPCQAEPSTGRLLRTGSLEGNTSPRENPRETVRRLAFSLSTLPLNSGVLFTHQNTLPGSGHSSGLR